MATNRDFKVKNGIVVSGDIQQDNAQYIKGKLANGTATRLFGLSGTDTFYVGGIDTATMDMLFVNNGAEQMRITPAGNVGVGTPTPRSRLHVHSTAGGGDEPYITLSNAGTGSSVSDGAFLGFTNTNELSLWNREAASLRFATSNAERMRIDASGNVGIGVTPTTKLHVQGVGQFLSGGAGTFSHLNVGRTASEARIAVAANAGDFLLNMVAGDVAFYNVGATKTFVGTAGAGELILSTNNADRMRINSAGEIGVGGVPTTGYKLRVFGDSVFSSLKIHATDAISRIASGSIYLGYENATALLFSTTPTTGVGTERMRITGTGEVLINRDTTSGLGQLQVAISSGSSIADFSASSGSAAVIRVRATTPDSAYTFYQNSNTGTSLSDGLQVGIDSTGKAYFANNETGAISFQTAAIERMSINASGVIADGAGRELGLKDVPISSNAWVRGLCNVVTADTSINVATVAGEVYSIFNDTGATIVLSPGAGLTMRLGGTTATGARSILPYGYATIWFRATNVCVVNGNVT